MSDSNSIGPEVYIPFVTVNGEANCLGGYTDLAKAKDQIFSFPEIAYWDEYAPNKYEGEVFEGDDREVMAHVLTVSVTTGATPFVGDDDHAKAGIEAPTLVDIFNAPEVKETIAGLKAQVEELNDKHLRAIAELQNQKRRFTQEKEHSNNDMLRRVLADILGGIDNLYRALELMDDDDSTKGVVMVLESFESALQKQGLEFIPTVGHSFDPSIHEALQQVVSPDHEPGTIVQEFERGYMRNGKLFRAARVIVAAPGSGTNPKPQANG